MEHIIFLHGALGAGSQVQPLADMLPGDYRKHVYTFSGHGGKPLPSEPLSIAGFASEVLAYMDAQGIEKADIFGYSMGGYVGMYLAQHHPERVHKLCTLATKWYWDIPTAEKEASMLDPETIIQKVPAFAETLAELHKPSDWKTLMYATASLLRSMGHNPPIPLAHMGKVQTEILLCLGDDDKMVPMSETEEVCSLLDNASVEIITQTKHPIDRANLAELSGVLAKFLGRDVQVG